MKTTSILISSVVALVSLSAAPSFADRAYSGNVKYKNSYKVKPSKHKFKRPYYKKPNVDKVLEARVVEIVNWIRARKGLPRLQEDYRAKRAARVLAAKAGYEGSFHGIRSSLQRRLQDQGLSIYDRELGELRSITSKYYDTDELAKRIVRSWLKNPRKARVLFDRDLSYIGVGSYLVNGKTILVLDAFGVERYVEPPRYDSDYDDDCNSNSYY